ncbi:hypothetical protein TWF730_008489 [Orbilia blumenaviensis]|uniref:F-box domain-containing protein n=1 Tax=Orbilia blumenaviensis TaxID=1796055 RepID=A0AAV9V2I0_9PEZI
MSHRAGAPLAFTALPEEILLHTLTYVSESLEDTLAVSITCKKLNRIMRPLLYGTVLISPRKASSELGPVDAQATMDSLLSQVNLIAPYIQHFGLCKAEPALDLSREISRERVTEDLMLILAKIPPGQLRSLRWDGNFSYPESIAEHLQTYQKNLETLIIDLWCNTSYQDPKKVKFSLDIFAFRNVRHLCLYSSSMPFSNVQWLLANISKLLINLKTLAVMRSNRGYHLWTSTQPTDEGIYSRSRTSFEIIYPFLETLACDDDDFGSQLPHHLGLESISQFPNLRSLYSRLCLSSRWLSNFDPKVPILLTTLEVQDCIMTVLSKFLLAFQGLVNLDIAVSPGEDYLDDAPILHHAATLKRLVLWKTGRFGRSNQGLMPIPLPLMRSLGKGLERLQEFCALIPQATWTARSGFYPKASLDPTNKTND